MARRKQLWELKGGKTFPTPGGVQEIGFANDAAKVTGKTKRSINMAVARGEKIEADVLQAVRGTKLGA